MQPQQPKPSILVLGDLIVDEFVYGECTRISPEAPVPVVNEVRRVRLGGAGNVAENLRALGADVTFWYGDKVSHKMRIVAGHQQVVRLDNDDLAEVAPSEQLEDWVYFDDAVVISDYRKGVVTADPLAEVNDCCRKFQKPLLVDPYNGRCQYGHAVTLIKPNRQEAQSVTGIVIKDTASLHAAAAEYFRLSGAAHLVITLGADGMALFYGNDPVHQPHVAKAAAQQVFDVTGAGDTAMAVLAYIWASGPAGRFSKRSAVDWAAKAASIVVGKLGTATVSYEELFGPYLDLPPETGGTV